ncbi:hypothetical protein BDF21DRAFT_447660 [Thamnidium elegans]|uniref:Uncharacterized protein n=1 Tax=Thamnidium elegans TaxID=101142 RepID=A0A8H7SR63_9FUNG|nr:hypothetical protein INT48_006857 [Thamnidium elegans]KAI8095392.1 hypothetical protein BDF21DRAFT_447660 [Thamnidium elegans]
MNTVKRQVGKCLYVPQMVDKVREMGVEQIARVEKQFPFLDQKLPSDKVSEGERDKRLKRIEAMATGLDNIFPWCPIPIGIGSILGFIPFIGGAMGSILSLYQTYGYSLFVNKVRHTTLAIATNVV